MTLIKVQVAPGVDKQSTEYGAEGRWTNTDNVRFRYGLPEKIGGWAKVTSDALVGAARGIITWFSLDGDQYAITGTNKKLYVYQNGSWYDITPIRSTGASITDFTTTASSTTVKVTDAAHGAIEGDLQKHWSDTSDTYVRRVPVAKGVQAGEAFLDKKLSAPPRPGEVWNPVSHRWTKEGNLGKVNVGSGGKKRLRAGSSAAGAHQKNVGGLSGKGRLRHLGTGRHFRGKIDIAEQAQGTKAGVGSGKSPTSVFRTGAKTGITSPKAKAKSGAFRSTPTRRSKRRPKSINSGKRSNLNVNQI